MDKNVSHFLELGKRGAERRFGELMDEVRVLFASFPHLSDAFDADELPVSFIIERDSHGARIKGVGRQKPAPVAVTTSVTRRIKNVHKAASKRVTRGNERQVTGRERG